MKCLFVTSKSPDHLSCVLWRGLQEVLGEQNVVDAVGNPLLHRSTAGSGHGLEVICGHAEGKILRPGDGPFDLVVIHSCFTRELTWDFVFALLKYATKNVKVAYVEGWDAAWQVEPPQMMVDAYFRKEIKPGVKYPTPPHHLTFALPEESYTKRVGAPRPWDVCFIGSITTGHPDKLNLRRDMVGSLIQAKRLKDFVLATPGRGMAFYYDTLAESKLALCPVAADGADSLRTYEAMSAGAVPVFVGMPDYQREDWFTPDTAYFCGVGDVADCVDRALSVDLTARRAALLEHGRKFHTTKARAEKVLRALGVT